MSDRDAICRNYVTGCLTFTAYIDVSRWAESSMDRNDEISAFLVGQDSICVAKTSTRPRPGTLGYKNCICDVADVHWLLHKQN